jgi:hypothetical protein
MTTATHLPENRRASFSLKKAVAPVTNFFVRIFEAFIEARRLQAAMETARHLKAHNADFKDMSYHEVIQFILEDTVIKTK